MMPQNTGFDRRTAGGDLSAPAAMIVDSRMNIQDDQNPMPPMNPDDEPPF